MPSPEQVAARLIGRPFAHRGRGPAAYDCWGLVMEVYRQTWGIELPDYAADGSRAFRAVAAATIEGERGAWIELAQGEERPGDVVMLRRFGRPLHLGVVLPQRRFLHADDPGGVSCPRYDAMAWRSRVLGFYRHPLRANRTS